MKEVGRFSSEYHRNEALNKVPCTGRVADLLEPPAVKVSGYLMRSGVFDTHDISMIGCNMDDIHDKPKSTTDPDIITMHCMLYRQ